MDGQWGWQKIWLKDTVRGFLRLNFPRVLVSSAANPAQFCGVPSERLCLGWLLYSRWKKLAQRAENTTQTSTSLFFKGQICSFDPLQSSMQEIFSLMLLLSSFFPPASLSLFRALRLFSGQQKNKVTDVTPIGYASSVLRNSASKWTSMPKIGGKLF